MNFIAGVIFGLAGGGVIVCLFFGPITYTQPLALPLYLIAVSIAIGNMK